MVSIVVLGILLIAAAFCFGFYLGRRPSAKIEIPREIFEVNPPLPEVPAEITRRRRVNAEENALKRDLERDAEKRRLS